MYNQTNFVLCFRPVENTYFRSGGDLKHSNIIQPLPVDLKSGWKVQKNVHYLKHKENLLLSAKNAGTIIILENHLLYITFYSLF